MEPLVPHRQGFGGVNSWQSPAQRPSTWSAFFTLLQGPSPAWGLLVEDVTHTSETRTVAEQAVTFGQLSLFARPALVGGAAAVDVVAGGRPLSVMGFTVTDGRIAAIDVFDFDRLAGPDTAVLDE